LQTRRRSKKAAASFVADVNAVLPKCNQKYVMNTDQSPFYYELRTTQSLDFIGEKKTYLIVGSESRTTHLYTIQPIATAYGHLLAHLLICFQETSGNEFGPIVAQRVQESFSENVFVTCSKSGKMTEKQVNEWITHCFLPNVSGETLLLLDSWSGQTEVSLLRMIQDHTGNDAEVGDDPQVLVKVIPPKTTPISRPLDVNSRVPFQ